MEAQNVYEHGLSVWNYFQKLYQILETGENFEQIKLPTWLIEHRHAIKESLFSLEIIEEYTTFHDVGKAYCRTIDENGKQHFPNHAEVSAKVWRDNGGDEQVSKLIEMDMLIHTLKDKDVAEFSSYPESITLLLVGLAEILSNSQLFGGFNSTSFKMKFKQLERRGNALCKLKFGAKYD